MTPNLRFTEKLAYGLGNFLPTVVTATAGYAMFFYTDVAGLDAAFIGLLLLLVRVADAVWDIGVGRLVDRTHTRFGRCRPYLLWAAPLLALALVASFTVPPLQGTARTVYFVGAYVALWFAYSLIYIPFQAVLPLMTSNAQDRLRAAGVTSFLQFLFVIAGGALFPVAKDALGAGDAAQGFQRAALLFASVGLLFTWICFVVIRERVASGTPAGQPANLRADAQALWRSRPWRAVFVAQVLLATLIGVPLGSGVYYFAVVIGQPQMIGPYMGLCGLGLAVGVVLSDQLTRRLCKRQVYAVSSGSAALVFALFLGIDPTAVWQPLVLGFVANLLCGVGAPISYSMNADTADAVELQSDRRVVGTLFATVNFAQKLGTGLASAITGGLLAWGHYQAGQGAAQSPEAVHAVVALMSVVPALLALGLAAVVGKGYTLNRRALTQLGDDLARQRAAQAAV